MQRLNFMRIDRDSGLRRLPHQIEEGYGKDGRTGPWKTVRVSHFPIANDEKSSLWERA
jgi:hypothetical protein